MELFEKQTYDGESIMAMMDSSFAKSTSDRNQVLGYMFIIRDRAGDLHGKRVSVLSHPVLKRQTECEPCTCQDQLFTYTAVT
jgi:hypothetical protein